MDLDWIWIFKILLNRIWIGLGFDNLVWNLFATIVAKCAIMANSHAHCTIEQSTQEKSN